MSEVQTNEKKKLTLSVDSRVVEKAKSLGLNLSEITEKVLRTFAFAPTDVDRKALYTKYRELFDTMVPMLRDYNASVQVAGVEMRWKTDPDAPPDSSDSHSFGRIEVQLNPDGTRSDSNSSYYVEQTEVHLLPDGTLEKGPVNWDYEPEGEWEVVDITEIPVEHFMPPMGILEGFIGAVTNAKSKHEDQIKELEMAKRIIAAINESTAKRRQGSSAETGKRKPAS